MIPTVERVLFLKRVAIFDEIPGELLVQVANLAEEVTFEPDETILREGDKGDCLYILVQGHARVLIHGSRVAELHETEFCGEMSLLDAEPRSATVIANCEVLALRISQQPFFELLAERAELSRGLIAILSRRLREMLAARATLQTI